MGLGEQLLEALEQRHRAWDLTVFLAWAALAVAVVCPPIPVNHDVALLLETGRSVAAGESPYVDYMETNPPFIHYLMALPAGLATALGAPLGIFYQLWIAGLLAVTLVACGRLLAKAPPMQRGLLLLALVAHGMVLAYAGDFGQKEHVTFCLCLPWLLQLTLWKPEERLPSWTILLGLMAAIGAQIKPHYVLADLAFLTSLLALRRSAGLLYTPAVAGFVLGGLAYPLLLWSLPAESWDAFVNVYLPFVVRNYWVYNSPLYDILGISSLPFLLYGVSAAVAYRWGERRLVVPLIVFLLLSAVAYFAQQKGFRYHRIPLLGVSACLAALGLYGLHSAERPLGLSAWLLWSFAALALGVRGLVTAPTIDPLFAVIAEHADPGDRVLFVNTAVPPEYPGALVEGYLPGGRYRTAFPIAMVYAGAAGEAPYRTLAEAGEDERRYFTELTEDVQRFRPPVVAISNHDGCKSCPEDFNILTLLEHNGFVRDVLGDYRRLEDVSDIALFVRTTPGGP